MALLTLLSSIFITVCIFFTQLGRATTTTLSTSTTDTAYNGTISMSTIGTATTMSCVQRECSRKTFDGSSHTHYTLKCGASNCESSVLKCPTARGSSCDVSCAHKNSCKSMTVWANDTDTLTIHCREIYACRFMKVHADYASNITINAQYHYSFGSAQLWASNAGSLSAICAAGDGDSACGDSIFNVGDNAVNTRFICYGTGCKDIAEVHYLYDYQAYINSITQTLLSVHISYCDQCSSAKECFGTWSITCEGKEDTFYGSKCSSNCGCDKWKNRITYSYKNTSSCIFKGGVHTETASGGAASVIITIVVILCCCVFVIYYMKYGRHNYYSPAGGARPATMQAVSQAATVQPAVVQQPPQQVVMQPVMQQQVVMQPMQPMQQQVIYQQPMQQQYIQAVPQQQVPQQYYPQQQAVTQPLQPQYVPASAPPAHAEGAVTNV